MRFQPRHPAALIRHTRLDELLNTKRDHTATLRERGVGVNDAGGLAPGLRANETLGTHLGRVALAPGWSSHRYRGCGARYLKVRGLGWDSFWGSRMALAEARR